MENTNQNPNKDFASENQARNEIKIKEESPNKLTIVIPKKRLINVSEIITIAFFVLATTAMIFVIYQIFLGPEKGGEFYKLFMRGTPLDRTAPSAFGSPIFKIMIFFLQFVAFLIYLSYLVFKSEKIQVSKAVDTIIFSRIFPLMFLFPKSVYESKSRINDTSIKLTDDKNRKLYLKSVGKVKINLALDRTNEEKEEIYNVLRKYIKDFETILR